MNRRAWMMVFASLLFLWFLWGQDLWAPDEPYFAEGAREMVVDGQWAVPHVNGVVTTDKPPLFFWLIALLSIPFGAVTPFTARLPSVLAALGTLAVVLTVGRRWYGERTAVLAAFVLSTIYLYWDKARSAQIDSLLCFLIWVSLAAFLAWRAGEADGRRAGMLFWFAAGLAVLAKGPVGFLLPLGIALLTLVCDRDLKRWRSFAPITGPLVFFAVVVSWMVYATVGGHGEYSVWGALKEHFVDRGMHGMHHEQPFWYYAKMLPMMLFPWSALAVGAVVLAWRRRREVVERFLLVVVVFVVVFFSISTEKRGLYVLPAMPAFALLIARLVEHFEKGWQELGKGWLLTAQAVVGGLMIVVGAALPFAANRVEEVGAIPAIVLAALLAAGGIVTLVWCAKRRGSAAAITPGLTVAVAYLVVVTVIYPALEPRKSARPFSLELKQVTAASYAQGQDVLSYGLGNLPEAFAFYTDGLYTVETDDWRELEAHLLSDAEVFAVVNANTLSDLSARAKTRMQVIVQTRLSRRDVLLVANHPVEGGRPFEVEPARPPAN